MEHFVLNGETSNEKAPEPIRLAFDALSMGRARDAIGLLETVDGELFPRKWLCQGHAYKAIGEHADAEVAYRRLCHRDDPAQYSVGWWSLANLKTVQFGLEDANQLDSLLSSDADGPYKGLLHLARAQIWHQAGLPEQAFLHLAAGNHMVADVRRFDPAAFHGLIQQLLQVENAAISTKDQTSPIFIIGQPRSGTTLVEQIIASHSTVDATDELAFMIRCSHDLETRVGYAASLALGDDEIPWDDLRKRYLGVASSYGVESGRRFIDKTPENFLHIPLALKLFPNAKFVHVIRDPLDNIVSQFRQFFAEGREYSYDLDAMIYYWQGYLTVMKHWSATFSDSIYHLNYENLASSPQEQIAALLEFLDLPEEAACFSPHESKRVVSTPSAAQVREPINRTAIGAGMLYRPMLDQWMPKIKQLKATQDTIFPR